MPLSRATARSTRAIVRFLAIGSVLLAGCLAAATAQAKTEVYSEATETTFIVPEGVHEVSFVAIGGGGGDAEDGEGGAGAKLSGRLAVIPGQTLYVEVGGSGKDVGEGGGAVYNGGAAGAGGGGGASDIRTIPLAFGLSPDPRLMVAGGGGGAGATGEDPGGDGGDAETDGEGASGYSGGGAGTQEKGGVGAGGCFSDAEDGDLGVGGAGRYEGYSTGPGGGGGGGYYGGGGGAGACYVGSSGGGGGSSLVPPLGMATLASPGASPLVEITWYPAPSVTVLTPADGATYTQGQVVHANYSCLPGTGATLASCVGTVANGAAIDTATVGQHTFTVDAEDKSKGKTTESSTYNVVKPPVPNTSLGTHPKKTIKTKKKKVKVKFGFSSNVSGATFKCKLDKGSFSTCSSPKTYKVKLGKHTFSVKAVGPGGTDPSPAKFTFKVKKKK